MEWERIGVIVMTLAGAIWTTFVYFHKDKKDEKQLHLSQSSEFYADLLETQKEMKAAHVEMTTKVFEYALQVNALTLQIQNHDERKIYLEEKVQRLAVGSQERERKIEILQNRENELEGEIARINNIQLERIEHESKVLLENEKLKTEIKEIKENIRTIVTSYEERLSKSDATNRTLTAKIKKQGEAIETMKEILEQNNLVANVDV